MKAIDAFLGKGLTRVNIKDRGKIVVDFAGIYIPLSMTISDKADIRDIEKVYDCIISQRGSYTVIEPAFVKEYPFLFTADNELVKRLTKWFNENSRDVIADLLKKHESKGN